jgi:2-polyprenyl-6-hydroxyphenyl methylase/3-demethylubiquinone-9 3-methyltransferase
VLDLGCGTGAWLKRLRESGFGYLTGIDRRHDRFVADARFICADFDQSPSDDSRAARMPLRNADELGTYDLITAIEIIEHVSSPASFIAFAAAHLAPNGWLVITTPNIHALRLRVRFLFTGKLHGFDVNADPEHVHPWLIGDAHSAMLARNGLELYQMLTYDSGGSRWFARFAERALSLVFPNDLPGDSLCLLLRKH